MGEPGLSAEVALQINQTLLFWVAAIFFGLACLAGLTALVFVWRECFVPRNRSRKGLPMEEDQRTTRRLVRFGIFEADLRSGELRRNGVKVKLQDQPFHVLEMLLDHPGDLVTREGLQKNLWSESTFVDFEHGLNAAIKRLREALGDDADNPRFVETLHRRGYRFIAPVAGRVCDEGEKPTVPQSGTVATPMP